MSALTSFAFLSSAFPSSFSSRSRSRRSAARRRLNRVYCPRAAIASDGTGNPNSSSNSKSKEPTRDPVSLGYLDDFDRDYYDELKAEYANNPNVSIYSKDDYELDDIDVGWLEDDLRGRDPQHLRDLSRNRPIPEGMAFAPLQYTDLHPKEDVDNFNVNARTYDPTTGIPWEDVPPDMDMYPDCEFSDFRYHNQEYKHDENHIPTELAFEPVERKVMTEEEERFELMRSLDELQEIDSNTFEYDEFYAPEGNVANPSQDEFRRWTEAAQARGGNSSEADSFVLPPMAHAKEQIAASEPESSVPPQYSGTAHAHLGRWYGEVEVIKLEWSRNSVSICSSTTFEIESDIDIEDHYLTWETSICFDDDDDEESIDHVSNVNLATSERGEEMSPERAIFQCGSYVTAICPMKHLKPQVLSLSSNCVDKLTDGSVAIIELCMMKGQGVTAERMRVIVCGRNIGEERGKKKKKSGDDVRITHIITIREVRVEVESDMEYGGGTGLVLGKTLGGKWQGTGVSLHPLFPFMPCASMTTTQEWDLSKSIELSNVTWTENDLKQIRDNQSSLSVEGSKTQRRSRRVRAAAAHDEQRLAKCDRICEDKIGKRSTEKHAWKVDDENGVGYSPRLGKFVHDYFAIAVRDSHVLFAPAKIAWPSLQNTVSLVESRSKRRRRLLANRSGENRLVGALLIEEVEH